MIPRAARFENGYLYSIYFNIHIFMLMRFYILLCTLYFSFVRWFVFIFFSAFFFVIFHFISFVVYYARSYNSRRCVSPYNKNNILSLYLCTTIICTMTIALNISIKIAFFAGVLSMLERKRDRKANESRLRMYMRKIHTNIVHAGDANNIVCVVCINAPVDSIDPAHAVYLALWSRSHYEHYHLK